MEIISLTSGELQYPALDKVIKAGVQAIQEGFTGYSPTEGIYELREKIADFYKPSQADIMPGNVLITGGARHAIYNVLGRLLDPGDEVILPTPYWFGFPEMILQARGKIKILETSFEDNFKIDPEKIKALISPKTKLFILTNPCNPSGKIYNFDEINAIVEIIKSFPKIHVLSDEIYEFINFSGDRLESINNWQSVADRVITVSGFSKSFAMSGWRVGYIIASEKLIQELKTYQEITHSGISIFSQKAAKVAWEEKDEFLKSVLQKLNENRNIGYDILKSIPGIECFKPEGTYYFFPCLSNFFGKKDPEGNVINEAGDIARYIFTDSQVQVLCGNYFGNSKHIRISFGMEKQQMIEGLERIKHSLLKIS